MKYATCCMTGGKRRNEDVIFARVYEESDKALFVVCEISWNILRDTSDLEYHRTTVFKG